LTELTLVLGSDVRGTDGFRGELRGVVVDQAARTVTHLAVEPKGRAGLARLVPMDLIDATGEIGLRCTETESTVDGATIPRIPKTETIDIVPPGEAEERRGDHVHATDGDVGQVHALRIDPLSRQVTHVIIQEEHLWAHKEAAIPVDKVARFGDGIWLSISKQQVQDL
jgi:sporulation protein YlmC with PRC-barrel domain